MKRIRGGVILFRCLIVLISAAAVVACANVAALSSADSISTFTFNGVRATVTISGTDIAVSVPWNTDVTDLVARFSGSSGANITVNGNEQVSGTTANDFSNPVTYEVTAQDGKSTKEYSVTVSVAGLSIADATSSGGAHNLYWVSLTSSSDGSHLAATPNGGSGDDIWTSSDGGATWSDQTAAGSSFWNGIASSGDGSQLAAVVGAPSAGDVWTSSDDGSTWTDHNNAGDPANKALVAIASSFDGSHLAAAVTGGDIWTSTNGGSSWTDRSAAGDPTGLYFESNAIASSSDGLHLAVAVQGSGSGGDIWTSTDGGSTWTDHSNAGDPTAKAWSAVASSSDGSHLAAVVYGGDIWASTDGGTTWTVVSESDTQGINWDSIASSSDGRTLIAGSEPPSSGSAAGDGDIWTSTDGGASWTDHNQSGDPTGKYWYAVTVSSDGSRFAAADNGGDIWVGK